MTEQSSSQRDWYREIRSLYLEWVEDAVEARDRLPEIVERVHEAEADEEWYTAMDEIQTKGYSQGERDALFRAVRDIESLLNEWADEREDTGGSN